MFALGLRWAPFQRNQKNVETRKYTVPEVKQLQVMESLRTQGADAVSVMRQISARLVSQSVAEGGHDLLTVERNFREAKRRQILTGCLRELETHVRDMELGQGTGGHGERLRGMVRSGVDWSQEVGTCWLATGRLPTESKSDWCDRDLTKKRRNFC